MKFCSVRTFIAFALVVAAPLGTVAATGASAAEPHFGTIEAKGIMSGQVVCIRAPCNPGRSRVGEIEQEPRRQPGGIGSHFPKGGHRDF